MSAERRSWERESEGIRGDKVGALKTLGYVVRECKYD